jgi:hypothetical protein
MSSEFWETLLHPECFVAGAVINKSSSLWTNNLVLEGDPV